MYRTTSVRAGPPIVPVRVADHQKLSQPGPYTGPYCPKSHDQHESNHLGGLRIRPKILSDHPPGRIFSFAPAFSPSVLTRGSKWPALVARADTAHADPVLTKTASPNPATLVVIRSGKINSNIARPMDGQKAPPSPPANPDSDVPLAASFGGNDGNSDYIELAKTHPQARPTRRT